jgi:ligand-binding sensor domain-containing protein
MEVADELSLSQRQIFHAYEDSRGIVWYCTASGVARRVGNRLIKLERWGPGHGIYGIYEQPGGPVWFRGAKGVYRAVDNGLELVDSDANARSLFTDRDGQLWIGTNGNGIVRVREEHVRTYITADGLPSNSIMTVIVCADGSIWTGANCGGLSRLDGEHFHTYSEKDGLLNSCVFGLAEDTAHDLWMGTHGAGAFRFRDGAFTQFSTQQGVASDVATSVFASRDGSVWLATPAGATRVVNGKVRNYAIAAGARVYNFYQSRSGALWALEGDQFMLAVRASQAAVPIGEDEAGHIYLSRQHPRGRAGPAGK